MPLARRLAGAALLLAAYLPFHRLLDVERTGPAGSSMRAAAETAWVLGLSGSLIVLTFAWLLARMVPYDAGRPDFVARLGALVARPGRMVFALALGVLSLGLTALLARAVHGGVPTSVDELAQLYHAAAVAGGRLGIPLSGSPAAWIAQNGIATDAGWVSIYPPMHTLLLAAGLAMGTPWLVGPVLTGVATGAFTWAADDLLGPRTGRLAGLLLCVSPFWLLLGASPANHVAAACGVSLVIAFGVRAARDFQDGAGSAWACATGAAVGFAVSSRPWVGLLCSAAILAALWGPVFRTGAGSVLARLGAWVVGGTPFAVLLFGWNAALFGSPLRLGYSAAFGPAHGLGFHDDPWGNAYGPLEAVGYTGADLLLMGVRLLEGPLPALALVGAALIMAPWRPAARVFGAWAGAGVVASLLYWHHGLHFGPRMLYETTPAWTALVAAAAAVLLGGGGYPRAGTAARFLRWTTLVTLFGGVAFAPTAIRSSGAGNSAPELPDTPSDRALVFVHGSWASRTTARLAAGGMRRDSIETALRRNDICQVDRYARWRQGGRDGAAPTLDLVALPGTPPSLQMRELSPGNRVRVNAATPPDATCRREANSDRFGTLELEFLVWRHPPLEGRAVVVARDLGPAGNLPALTEWSGDAYVLVDGAPPNLLDYAEGMELVWGGAAGAAGR